MFYVTIIADTGRSNYLASNGMLTRNRKYGAKFETRKAAEDFHARMVRMFGSNSQISVVEARG